MIRHDRENPQWTPRDGDGKEGVYLVSLKEDSDVQILLACEDQQDEPRRVPPKKHHVPAVYYHPLPAFATTGNSGFQRTLEAGSKPLAPRGPLDVSSAYVDLRVGGLELLLVSVNSHCKNTTPGGFLLLEVGATSMLGSNT